MLALGALLLAAFAALLLWQAPGMMGGRMSAAEVNRYMATVEGSLHLPAEQKVAASQRLRAWAEADDGKPFYMLNLMRYHDQLRTFPGAPAFAGTPQQANALYEEQVTPLLLRRGGYPAIAAAPVAKDLLGHAAPLDDWSRVLVVRYPNRRAFMELITDPAYGPIDPYKLMALDVVLVPMKAELVLPDLRVLAGGAALL
ncbi:MAG: hypothetical protein ACKVUT_13820, partial [Gaiella sp.]